MVGIVGILLLGSLAWSAVGALVSAAGAAGSALSSANAGPPTLAPVVAVTPVGADNTAVLASDTPAEAAATGTTSSSTPVTAVPGASMGSATPGAAAATGTPRSLASGPATSAPIARVTSTPAPPAIGAAATVTEVATTTTTSTPAPTSAPTALANGRNPWILLPLPEPGARVTPGQVMIEARGRGDAPIKAMRLELDGAALPVALEQRSDSTWRGSTSARVAAGAHNVRASVTDAAGRSGSYRWSFTASAAPGP